MAGVKLNAVAVQNTNDCSVLSKCSMIAQGYFDDEMLPCFVTKVSRRSPLINRGYYIRAKAVEHTFQVFLQHVGESGQILSLGAGYDCTYFRLVSKNILPKDIIYFEVDFPEVIQRKKSVILKQDLLLKYLNMTREIYATCAIDDPHYKLIGADLQDTPALVALLRQSGFSTDKPTLILSECVTVYMEPNSCAKLLQWAALEMDNALFASYEQIHPEDGFGQVMINHFKSIGSPLKGISVHSTKHLQRRRFISLGWKECVIFDMNEIFDTVIDSKEKDKINCLEPFDEFEEWHLKCNHYVVIWAAVGNFITVISKFSPKQRSVGCNTSLEDCYVSPLQYHHLPDYGVVRRFGHTSWITQQCIISSGGFGDEKGCHRRLESLCVTDIKTGFSTTVASIEGNSIGPRIFHTSTLLSNGTVIVLGGRTSPQKASSLLLTLQLYPKANELGQRISLNECKYRVQEIVQSSSVVPCIRWRHSACSVSINNIEYICLFGGRTSKDKCLSDCYLLNTETFLWKEILSTTEAPTGRHSHSANSWESNIVVACGLEEGEIPSNSIHLLKCSTFTWTRVTIEGILPRYSHSSHVIKNKLILIGGVNTLPDLSPGVAVIDLTEETAWELKFSITSPELPILLHNHTSVISQDENEILVLGGGGNCFSFGTHFNQGMIKISVKNLLGSTFSSTT